MAAPGYHPQRELDPGGHTPPKITKKTSGPQRPFDAARWPRGTHMHCGAAECAHCLCVQGTAHCEQAPARLGTEAVESFSFLILIIILILFIIKHKKSAPPRVRKKICERSPRFTAVNPQLSRVSPCGDFTPENRGWRIGLRYQRHKMKTFSFCMKLL